MTVAVLVMSDGRDEYLGRAVASLESQLKGGPVVERWLHDDSGDEACRARLAAWYPQYRHIGSGPRRGFAGAYAHAWQHLATESEAAWVFGAEGDYTYNQVIDLDAMAAVLEARPYLAQMALKRQPWGAAEVSVGGFMNLQPDAYVEMTWRDYTWLQHTLYLTSNPCLYRRDLCALGWPPADPTLHGTSEGTLARRLMAEGLPWGVPGEHVRFAFWGRRHDPPAVHHIGDIRVGHGY